MIMLLIKLHDAIQQSNFRYYEGGFRLVVIMRTASFEKRYDAPLQIVVVATIHCSTSNADPVAKGSIGLTVVAAMRSNCSIVLTYQTSYPRMFNTWRMEDPPC